MCQRYTKGVTKTMKLQEILQLSRNFGWIHQVQEAIHDEAEMIHDAWLGIVSDAAKNRHEEIRKVRADIKTWINEPDMVAFGKVCRMRYLQTQLRVASKLFKQNRERYIVAVQLKASQDTLQTFISEAEGLSKRIRGYEVSIEVLEGKRSEKNTMTDEMIERAREYPIKNLIEIGPNGRAKCVFHGGDDYNMDIRKNFAHCYVCSESGDTINIYRAKHGASFQEAIIALQ